MRACGKGLQSPVYPAWVVLGVAFLMCIQHCGNCWLETRGTQFWIAEKAQRDILDIGQVPDGKLETVEGKKLGALQRKMASDAGEIIFKPSDYWLLREFKVQ